MTNGKVSRLPLQRHLTMARLEPLFLPVPFDAKDTLGSFFAGPTRPIAVRHASCRFLWMGKMTASNTLNCDMVSAGAFFPQTYLHMP
jgi:hypothetical protein